MKKIPFINFYYLYAASLILHEAIHAYLIIALRDDPRGLALDYPHQFEYYAQHNSPNLDETQHEEMVYSFINDMAKVLKAYSDSQGYKNIDEAYCKDIAWSGLQGTEAFKSMGPLEQQNIKSNILAEQTSENYNGDKQNPKGQYLNCY